MRGAYVFPGGVLENVDKECCADAPQHVMKLCAIRELFEETGTMKVNKLQYFRICTCYTQATCCQ